MRKMERTKELARTIWGFCRSTLFPVYLENDVPLGSSPLQKVIWIAGEHKEKIKLPLTMLSWNILRNYNRQEIVETLQRIIQEHNPNVFLFQEAPPVFLEEQLFAGLEKGYVPLHQVLMQTPFYNFEHVGQATLAREAFTKRDVFLFPSVTTPILGKNHVLKRVGVYTQLKINSRRVGMYNIHLENAAWQNGREKQIKYLLQIISDKTDEVVVIGGDFNTFLGSRAEQGLRALENAGFENMFPKSKALPRLDYFFVKGAKAISCQLRGKGSDHQPILVRIFI